MERYELDHEYLKSILNYNPETGDWTWIKKTSKKVVAGKKAGGIRPRGYTRKEYYGIRINKVLYISSILAYFYMTGKWPENQIDHIDGDGLNNRWNNLRNATVSQNRQNITHKSKKSTLPMGVYAIKHRHQISYAARIELNKTKMYLGSFPTPEKAHAVYLEKRRELFGEYNRL